MDEAVGDYAKLWKTLALKVANNEPPFLIGIAGAPASGKSTLAEQLVADFNEMGIAACYCPMDGFHLRNAVLDALGLRCVKGRIDTFDAQEFTRSVKLLKEGIALWWPLYSRQRHEPIAEGTRISGTEKVFVIEGNYVLDRDEPWLTAARDYDLRIFVDAPDAMLRERLLDRHKHSGRSVQEAANKIDQNDMQNARKIRERRQDVDIIYRVYADE